MEKTSAEAAAAPEKAVNKRKGSDLLSINLRASRIYILNGRLKTRAFVDIESDCEGCSGTLVAFRKNSKMYVSKTQRLSVQTKVQVWGIFGASRKKILAKRKLSLKLPALAMMTRI